MSRHRSITQRLKRCSAPEVKRAIAQEWAQAWELDHNNAIRRMEQAIQADDYDQLCRATGQLKALHEKRMNALPQVLAAISPQ